VLISNHRKPLSLKATVVNGSGPRPADPARTLLLIEPWGNVVKALSQRLPTIRCLRLLFSAKPATCLTAFQSVRAPGADVRTGHQGRGRLAERPNPGVDLADARSTSRAKRPTIVVTAIARELSAFIWAINREVGGSQATANQ
jgi:hypothetical protein